MKLDMSCVRDILITLEQQPHPVKMPPEQFSDLLLQYPTEQIIYTCWRLYEGGYINLFVYTLPGSSENIIRLIGDLTFDGHEFLADIKPKSNWERLSPALKQGWSASFATVANVALALGTEALKHKLGLLPE